MRRPLCAVGIGMLGVGLICAFLPQTVLFMPFAAFFVLCTGLLLLPGTRKLAGCLALGCLLGLGCVWNTERQLERTRVRYAQRKLVLTAEVLTVEESYLPGKVEAVLRLEKVNGTAAHFLVHCDALPACEAGARLRGRFVLSEVAGTDKLDSYADGIALEAELLEEGCIFLVPSSSFRARTARLQKTLSRSLRRGLDAATGGVLAAMTVGDRSFLSSELRSAYRGAGLSHVLVVSGLHVSILCGSAFGGLLPRRRQERSACSRRVQAVWTAALALILVGVTGFTPSVRRAAVAVWISALGVWVHGAPDALTSLAAAGILMMLGNSYAVCDVGFELSFAAVLGTLGGAEMANRAKAAWRKTKRKRPRGKPRCLQTALEHGCLALWETVCVSVCASAATFPVLVLRGLSVSLYAVLSSVAVLWLVQPMLMLGFAAAFVGLLPGTLVYRFLCKAAGLLAAMLNGWACWLAQKPGAGLYFDTAYAAWVCVILIALGVWAAKAKLRLRVAAPAILLAAALAIGVGNALCRDVIHLELVGSARNPSLVVSQNGTAVVLFRGGTGTQQRIEQCLARRGVRTVELVIDLRTAPEHACPIAAERTLRAEELPFGGTCQLRSTPALLDVLRTAEGCLVQLTIGNRRFVMTSGTVQLAKPLAADWLVAGSGEPVGVQYRSVLSLRRYDWMDADTQAATSLSLRRHGGVLVR